ncbi:hypothetical protein Calle1_37 [Cellulophaga phage Calle_1]|uniref:Uncharacterized protein n=1 Tax=Cellulophaga phage Calle_1 TaxID=2745643 RepID=A0A8E5E8Z8_9CAUD|nr:hypothetical protein M1M22_gp078 [Cellulophaga phage Calle_1]QQV89693.1 hypothetical protein Calle1_37 [Cellulophaga phage Calle_1]QQV89811.1 hypothetical protein Calle2_37 [Cellulophaga phage Calle_2]QQV89908.1 hypothetical protein Calle3_37 [Cellulophaga phage Calle_3]
MIKRQLIEMAIYSISSVAFAIEELESKLQDWKRRNIAEGNDEPRLYPRRCDVTGEGMDKGYLFHDTMYIKYLSDAKKMAKENGYDSLQDSYDSGFHYWTEWEQEAYDGGSAYDIMGKLYLFKVKRRGEGDWVKQ